MLSILFEQQVYRNYNIHILVFADIEHGSCCTPLNPINIVPTGIPPLSCTEKRPCKYVLKVHPTNITDSSQYVNIMRYARNVVKKRLKC